MEIRAQGYEVVAGGGGADRRPRRPGDSRQRPPVIQSQQDAWAPYDTYANVDHQLRCAHALRELAAVADTVPSDAQWCWADQTTDALVAMQKLVAKAIAAADSDLDQDALGEQVVLYRSATQIGVSTAAARSDKVMKKHKVVARGLLNRQDDYLRCTTDWRIPPDNNGSERDIRMIKLRQEVSGCLRTLSGATQFRAIRSYLSTAAQHGNHLFEASSCSPRADRGPELNGQ